MAFDAVADRGHLTIGPTKVRGKTEGDPAPLELRIIGDDLYRGRPDTGQWKRRIPRSDLTEVLGAATPGTSSLVGNLTVDPRALLELLRKLGDLAPSASGGYTFSYPVAANALTAAHQVTGTVEVDAGTHLLTRVTQQTVTVGANPAVADAQPLTLADHHRVRRPRGQG